MKEAEDIIRETREMIDEMHRNVTGKPASDDAVMLSLATQVYLLRKKVATLEQALDSTRTQLMSHGHAEDVISTALRVVDEALGNN